MSEDQRKDAESGTPAREGDNTSSTSRDAPSAGASGGQSSSGGGSSSGSGSKSGSNRSRSGRNRRGGAKKSESAAGDKAASKANVPAAADKTSTPAASQRASSTDSEGKSATATGAASANRPSATGGAAGGGTRAVSGGRGGGGGRGAWIVAGIALVVAVIALVIAVWLWVRGGDRMQALAARMQTVEKGMQSNVQKVVMPKLSDFDDRLQSLSDKLQDNDDTVGAVRDDLSGLSDKIESVQTRVAGVVERIDSAGNRWQLHRIESLLQAANQRLQLYDDPKGARQALELASDVIGRMSDPRLFKIRKAIVDEVAALQALPNPDVEGLSLALSAMVERVPKLPLASDVPQKYRPDNGKTPKEAASGVDFSKGWNHFVDSVGDALSNMLTIRRSDGTTQRALMPPDQAFFLTQNLQLQLRAARLALLERKTQSYQDSLASARDWLKQYYDTDASPVSSMLERLNQMSNVKLDWQPPDISDSLSQLRALMAKQGESDDGTSGANDATPSSAGGSTNRASPKSGGDTSGKASATGGSS